VTICVDQAMAEKLPPTPWQLNTLNNLQDAERQRIQILRVLIKDLGYLGPVIVAPFCSVPQTDR